jgi:hypothetical protein
MLDADRSEHIARMGMGLNVMEHVGARTLDRWFGPAPALLDMGSDEKRIDGDPEMCPALPCVKWVSV